MRLSNLRSGETIGAIAVVLSLIFVGIEIRDGNREARAAVTQAALDAEMAFQAELIEHADVWQRVVMDGEELDAETMRRAIALYNMLMTVNDNRLQMMNSGYIEFHDGGLREVVTFPFYEIWRGSPGAAARPPGFLSHVDDIRQRATSQ